MFLSTLLTLFLPLENMDTNMRLMNKSFRVYSHRDRQALNVCMNRRCFTLGKLFKVTILCLAYVF